VHKINPEAPIHHDNCVPDRVRPTTRIQWHLGRLNGKLRPGTC
jgi:hypothetical protein